MDASEIYSKRLNAKEVIFPKEKGKFIFPIADGRIKLPGGDQELRTPTLIREHPIRGESRKDFLRIRLEGVLFSYHEDHIAAKRNKFTESLQFGAHIYPMPQALTIPDAKAAVENESENWTRFRHGSR